MGKQKKGAKRAKDAQRAERLLLPKRECCESRRRCDRCPLRMLKEGTLPAGYTVKKRRLVRIDGATFTKKDLRRAA